jgi:predicted phosphodiesterase
MPRVVLIADTHGLHDRMTQPVPEGDLLIHAGDFTNVGRVNEVVAAGVWLRKLGKRFPAGVVIVAGNHDWMFEKNRFMAVQLLNQGLLGNERVPEIIYLEDSGVEIKGLKIYGSPWQPSFMNWAFNLDRGEPLRRKWDLIPEGLDILVTHGPPMGILDQTNPVLGTEHVGCEELIKAVKRAKPKVHVFGHIHGGYGRAQYQNTLFINAAICDEAYKPWREPVVIDL